MYLFSQLKRYLTGVFADPLMRIDRLLSVNTGDTDTDRRGRLLNIMLVTLLLLVVLLTATNALNYADPNRLMFLSYDAVVIVWLLLLWRFNHLGHVTASAYLFVFGTFTVILFTFASDTLLSLGILFVFPLMLAGFLIHPRLAFVLFVLSVIGYNVRIATLPAERIGYLALFNSGTFLLFTLLSGLLANDIRRALTSERTRARELDALNRELDERVQQKTLDLADALSREHSEGARRQAILDSIADGVIVFSPDGMAELANPAIATLLDQPLAAIVEQSAERILRPLNSADRGTILAMIRGEGPAHAVLKIDWPINSGSITLSVSLATVTTPTHRGPLAAGTVAVFRDVTKEAELDRLKSDIISMAAHELRTPMTVIKGFTDLLASGASGSLSPEQDHFLGVISGNVTRLTAMIEDMLDVGRLDSGKVELNLQVVALRKIVDQVAITLAMEFVRRNLKFAVEYPADLPPVLVDEGRIAQVVTNLLSNAYKYTREGSVTLRAYHDDGYVRVEVEDTGLGMTPEAQVRLFQRFYRVRTEATDGIPGTGLGLAIVKSIIEMHGGEIKLAWSEPGKGSCFTFTLPLPPGYRARTATGPLR